MQDTNNVTNEFIFNYLVKINDKVDLMSVDVSTLKTDVTEIKSKMATKQDVEALAISTAKGFAEVNKNISNLNEKVDDVEKNLIDQIEDLARMTNGALAAKQDKFVYA